MSSTPPASDLTAMEQLAHETSAAWAKVNVHKYVRPGAVRAAHQYLVRSQKPWSDGESELMATSADFIPVVTIEGLPTNRYPEFLPVLTSAAIACMRLIHPSLALALESVEFRKLIHVAVAARAGMWAAVNWTPNCDTSVPRKAIVYDKKTRNVWLSGTRGEPAHDLWLAMMSLKAPQMPDYGEGLSHVAIVAPMCGVMAASLQTSLGPLYSFDLAMERVNTVLESRMGTSTAGLLGVGSAETTEVMTMAVLTSVPLQVAQVWATDPLVAVGAQRRIAATPSEVAAAKRREARLTSGRATPANVPSYDLASVAGHVDPMLDLIRAHKEELEAPEQAPTVVNDAGEAEEPEEGASAATPRPARSVVDSVSRVGMTAEETRFIHEVARHAQQNAPPVPSMLNGANEDESAVW